MTGEATFNGRKKQQTKMEDMEGKGKLFKGIHIDGRK